jgi:ABC-type transport system involved in Fe-S cluster assembly fused permease/ATPase subunit
MAGTPVEETFIALLRAIDAESERLQETIREAVSQADLSTAQAYQEKLKKLLSFRANLIKAHRKWYEQ